MSEPAPQADETTAPEPPVDDETDGKGEAKAPPRRKMIRGAIAMGGFVLGLVAGTYGEELIQRTNPGFFGPDNQAVIEEQAANFAALEARLAALKLEASDDPKTQAAIVEIETLLATSKEIAAKKDEMFKATDIEAQTLKKQMLEQTDTTSGVDFWIARNESMVLVDSDKVLSIVGTFSNTGILANVSGKQAQLDIGEGMRFETTDGPRDVIYRHGKRDSDGRYGFDLARPGVENVAKKIK